MCWEGMIPRCIQRSNYPQHLHQLSCDGLGKELVAGWGGKYLLTASWQAAARKLKFAAQISSVTTQCFTKPHNIPRVTSYRMTQLNYRHDFGQSSVLNLVIQLIDLQKQQITNAEFSSFPSPNFFFNKHHTGTSQGTDIFDNEFPNVTAKTWLLTVAY